YFFFQAEDGIRDFHVTGVQTCALPISNLAQYNQLQQMLSESFPSLIEAFGSELVTEESLSKFEPTEETIGGMFMFGILPKEYWRSEERRVGKEWRGW